MNSLSRKPLVSQLPQLTREQAMDRDLCPKHGSLTLTHPCLCAWGILGHNLSWKAQRHLYLSVHGVAELGAVVV